MCRIGLGLGLGYTWGAFLDNMQLFDRALYIHILFTFPL